MTKSYTPRKPINFYSRSFAIKRSSRACSNNQLLLVVALIATVGSAWILLASLKSSGESASNAEGFAGGGRNDNDEDLTENGSTPEESLLQSKTASEGLSTSSTFHSNDNELEIFREQEIRSELSKSVSPLLLNDERTPQGMALEWIVHEDERQLCLGMDTGFDDGYDYPLLQRYVLAVLYFATGGEDWDHDRLHWMSRMHECHWYKKIHNTRRGVMECNDDMKVTKLSFADNSLQFALPSELKLLYPHLVVLDLEDNHLGGTIPFELGRMTNLKYLSLAGNQLTGTVPSTFGKMTALEQLYLQHNPGLTGSVPEKVCDFILSGKSENIDNNSDAKMLESLVSDCDNENMQCDCCTMCCGGGEKCRTLE